MALDDHKNILVSNKELHIYIKDVNISIYFQITYDQIRVSDPVPSFSPVGRPIGDPPRGSDVTTNCAFPSTRSIMSSETDI